MLNVSSDDIQKYTRIILYVVSGALIQHGFGSQASWEPWIGIGVTVANFAWTLYGNRLVAQINALAASGHVSAIVVRDQDVADSSPSSLVTSTAETTVVKKP